VFPTVASGTIFNTIIAIDYSILETVYKKSFDLRRLIDFVKENVIKALDVGVGAKTNLGYGRIRAVSQTEYVRERSI
jgi:CRISPR/Cas system CMR subunit Cmr6 (Cas7 group RAMP superfamily)